jgi:phosphoribosylanthranilate isomerase
MPIQTKICGLSDEASLDAAIAGGASHVGFVFFPPSPRDLAPEHAAALIARVPAQVGAVGVFVDPDDALLDRAVAAGLTAIQLHGSESPDRVAAIRARFGLPVWKALPIRTRADFDAGGAMPAPPTCWSMMPRPRLAPRCPAAWGCGSTGGCSRGSRIRCPGRCRAGSTGQCRRGGRDRRCHAGRRLLGRRIGPGVKDVDKIAAFLQAVGRL